MLFEEKKNWDAACFIAHSSLRYLLLSTLPCFTVPSKDMVVMCTSGCVLTSDNASHRGSERTFVRASACWYFPGSEMALCSDLFFFFFPSMTYSLELDHWCLVCLFYWATLNFVIKTRFLLSPKWWHKGDRKTTWSSWNRPPPCHSRVSLMVMINQLTSVSASARAAPDISSAWMNWHFSHTQHPVWCAAFLGDEAEAWMTFGDSWTFWS